MTASSNRSRKLPGSIKISLMFGGFMSQLGWLFFAVGILFFWIFASQVDFSFLQFTGEIVKVPGIITDSIETGNEINEQSVYENHYKFATTDGDTISDFSFATGRSLRPTSEVTIEYPLGRPDLSRIQGMRREPFGLLALLSGLFPGIALIFVVFAMKKGNEKAELLQFGAVTPGKLVAKQTTGAEINNQPVYKLTFAFQDQHGREHRVSAKTHRPELLEDDSEEQVFYMPDAPDKAVLLDSLPGAPQMDHAGNIKPAPIGRLSKVLLLPGITGVIIVLLLS